MGPFESCNQKYEIRAFLVAAAAAQYAGDGTCANRESCTGSGNRGDLVCCTEAEICTNSTLNANDLWPNSVSGNCTDFPETFAASVACCVPIPETTTEETTTATPTSGALQTTISAVAALLLSYIL